MHDLPAYLSAEIQRQLGCDFVVVHGELDFAGAVPLKERLMETGAAMVVVDLAELTFVDAAGISALLSAREELGREGRRLVLRGALPQTRRVFDVLGLAHLLEDVPP